MKHLSLSLCLLALFIPLIFTSCTRYKTLTVESFDQVVSSHKMRVSDEDAGRAEGARSWKNAISDDNGSIIRLIRFGSEGEAASFASSQVSYVESLDGISKGGGSHLDTTIGGAYYFITTVRDMVIFATAPEGDADSLREVLSELPEVE